MQTGDGLLARLRVKDGRLSPAQLSDIAALAAIHGNGLVEITARGNLQVRGLTTTSTPHFAQAVRDLIGIEDGLVVETPPLAGDDPGEIADPRPLAANIAAHAAPFGDQLGPKVTVVVDGNGAITRAKLKADVRLLAVSGVAWVVMVQGEVSGPLTADEAGAMTVAVLKQVGQLGVHARASDLDRIFLRVKFTPPLAQGQIGADSPLSPIGTFSLTSGTATGIALPFGASDAPSLIALARLAAQNGITEFRLAPHHALLAIDAPASFATDVAAMGFITDPADPRLAISACIGSAGCASGFFPARAVAEKLSATLPQNKHLHVSGCSKGCAHPRRAEVTLVGRAGGYGLVINGTAGDTPHAVLRADASESDLAAAIRQG